MNHNRVFEIGVFKKKYQKNLTVLFKIPTLKLLTFDVQFCRVADNVRESPQKSDYRITVGS